MERLLADLAIFGPVNVRNDRPMPGDVADLLAPYEQRDPEDDNHSRDASHGAKGVLITCLRDPGVRIKREEEAKEGYISRLSDCLAHRSRVLGQKRVWGEKGGGGLINSHLNPITAKVTSPAMGRYASIT